MTSDFERGQQQGRVLIDVHDELERQHEKWGAQDHRDGTGPKAHPLLGIGTSAVLLAGQRIDLSADAMTLQHWAKVDCQSRGGEGEGSKPDTWTAILLEEVFEALAEDGGSAELRAELIQVAAVAVQWVLAMDRANAAAEA